jgi:RsiW-degrading membrane proteinase PrsW (M82 family)
MSINTILLVIAALVPAIFLCCYVYKKDKVENEPVGLLLLLFFAGVFSCFPAIILENMISPVIGSVFNGLCGLGIPVSIVNIPYTIATHFFGVALVEEGLKWLFLLWITKNNKNFNCTFDGLIYAVFVSLGFAAFENIMYVVQNGWVNAVMRAVLSVPGHMFFAVMMGYYYSRWNLVKNAAQTEAELVSRGIIEKKAYPEFNYKRDAVLSIVMPILFHGTYNSCCSMNLWIFTIAFYAFVVFMYRHCLGKIKEMSMEDAPNGKRMVKMLLDKYPDLYEKVTNS